MPLRCITTALLFAASIPASAQINMDGVASIGILGDTGPTPDQTERIDFSRFVADIGDQPRFFERERSSTDPQFADYNNRITGLFNAVGTPERDADYDVVIGFRDLSVDTIRNTISGSLFTGHNAPAGTQVRSLIDVSFILEFVNNRPDPAAPDRMFNLGFELELDSIAIGGPDVDYSEFISVDAVPFPSPEGFLPPEQFSLATYDTSNAGTSPVGDLFTAPINQFTIPEPGWIEREAVGSWGPTFGVPSGETMRFEVSLLMDTEIINRSDAIAQQDLSRSLDFTITIDAEDGLSYTIVPEPGSLALLALGAPLVMRRRRMN